MKNVKNMRALASILLIFLLFTAIVLRSLSAVSPSPGMSRTLVSKKADTTSKSDTQLLFDVREGEERSENGCGNKSTDDLQSNFYFIGLVSSPTELTIAQSNHYPLYHTSRSFGNATGIPLYLAQRSFLI